jgi:hypothetical protein
VILVSSFPFAINWTQSNIPAILYMAHSSQDEGTALGKLFEGHQTCHYCERQIPCTRRSSLFFKWVLRWTIIEVGCPIQE